MAKKKQSKELLERIKTLRVEIEKAKKAKKKELVVREKTASIIGVIQDMVAQGQSEASIVRTLEDLGVEPSQAKRLLLLGQADTFALLRGEIGKIVDEEIEKSKKELRQFMAEEAESQTKNIGEKIEKQVRHDLESYEKKLTSKSEQFQIQSSQAIKNVTELSNRVRAQLNNLGEQVKNVRIDLDELRITGIGKRSRAVSGLLFVLGLVFVIASLGKFFLEWGQTLTVDSVILTVIFAFVGMGLLFLAAQF